MIKAQLPQEVLTVEDRFFGPLTLGQVGLLGPAIFINLVIIVGLSPSLSLNLIKASLIGLVSIGGGCLAYRFNGKLGWEWLVIIYKFRQRLKRSKQEEPSGLKHLPVVEPQGRIIKVGGDQYRLILEVSGLNFELLTDQEQETILAQFQQFLNSMIGNWQILTKTRQLNIDQYLSNFKKEYQKTVDLKLYNSYRKFVSSLVANRRILGRKFYLVLSQPNQTNLDCSVAESQLLIQAEIASRSLQSLGLTTKAVDEDEIQSLIPQMLQFQSKGQDEASTVADQFQESVSSSQTAETFSRSLAITGYPAYLTTSCLISLTKTVDNLDIGYHYRHLPKEIALTKLNRKITELESRLNKQSRLEATVSPEISQPLASATILRDQIYSSDSNLFEISIYLNLTAESIQELDQLTDKLQASLASRLFQSSTNYYQQLEGLVATSPIAVDNLRVRRNFDGSSASLTLPFISGDLIEPTGILYGVNLINNSLVIIDRFKLTNANSVSLGQSGSGKSYCQKLEIMRLLMIGCQVIVIDPEAEYIDLAKKVNGQIVDLAEPDQTRINLLDVGNWRQSNQQDPQTVADLISIIDNLVGGLDNQQISLLDKTIGQIYQTRSNPTLTDLHQEIKTNPKLQPVSLALDRFVNGSCGKIFNRKSNIDLGNPLIVFNLAKIADSLKPIILLILNFYFKWQLTNKDRPKLLVIDEAWLLVENKVGARLMISLIRRARKHNLGVALISQEANDFLSQPLGQTLIAQASLKSLFKADTASLRGLRRQFHLSQYQINFLKTATSGKAIILADDQAAACQIAADQSEEPVVRTDPKHLTSRS